MKINSKVFRDYIQKVSLNNTIMTINLEFTDSGVKTIVTEPSNIAMVSGFLKSEVFEDYSPIGKIFIKNSKFLHTELKTFIGKVSIEKVDDYLIKLFDTNREVFIMLADESICSNIIETEMEIDVKNYIDITKDDLVPVVKDMKDLGMGIVYNTGKEIIFQIGKKDEYDFTRNRVTCSTEGNVKTAMNSLLIPYVDTLTNPIKMGIVEEMPLVFLEETDTYRIRTIFAPIIESD